jgi:hypothetical protein
MKGESRGMDTPSRNTKPTRHGPSKASTGWSTRLVIAVVIFAVTISQMIVHTFVDDSTRQLLQNHDQEILRLIMPMNFSKRSKGKAGRGNRTRAVAQRKERPSTLTEKRQTARYAYAFVIGGCKPDDEVPTYRYFIYNILVSTRVLREAGSQADVVAFFQISYKSTYDKLPSEDVRMLEAMNVRIEYIPKSPHESFYRTGEYMSCGLA